MQEVKTPKPKNLIFLIQKYKKHTAHMLSLLGLHAKILRRESAQHTYSGSQKKYQTTYEKEIPLLGPSTSLRILQHRLKVFFKHHMNSGIYSNQRERRELINKIQ